MTDGTLNTHELEREQQARDALRTGRGVVFYEREHHWPLLAAVVAALANARQVEAAQALEALRLADKDKVEGELRARGLG
jgi:hypothetical protein